MFRYASENVNKLLVGNKSDLTSKRAVSYDQAKVIRTYQLVSFATLLTNYSCRSSLTLWASSSSRLLRKVPQTWRRPSWWWPPRSNPVIRRNLPEPMLPECIYRASLWGPSPRDAARPANGWGEKMKKDVSLTSSCIYFGCIVPTPTSITTPPLFFTVNIIPYYNHKQMNVHVCDTSTCLEPLLLLETKSSFFLHSR